MSILGEKLREIFESNDTNVYQLSKRAGIDRSTIHKVISNGRTPSAEFMTKLIDALALTPGERHELIETFEIQRVGEFIYNQRKQVREMIDRIAVILDAPMRSDCTNTGVPSASRDETEVVYGDLPVNNLIEDIINIEVAGSDSPKISFFMPPDHKFFFEFLFVRYSKTNKLKLECILEFSKNKMGAAKRNLNLDVIQSILPFILMPKNDFDAYYLYSDLNVRESVMASMPFYLLTSEHSLLFSADMRTAVLHKSPEITSCYRAFFDNALQSAKPLISRPSMPGNMLGHYLSLICSGRVVKASCIEAPPCMFQYFTDEMINDHICDYVENRTAIIELTCEYRRTCQDILAEGTLIFTKAGLEEFIKHRKSPYIPSSFTTPFYKHEMEQLLQRIISDTQDDVRNFRMLNPVKMSVCESLIIDIFSPECIVIATGSAEDSLYENVITISEESVVNAFEDFVSSIAESDIVYSKEDTLRALRDALDSLGQADD